MTRSPRRLAHPVLLLPFLAGCVQLDVDREPATAQRPTLSADTNTVPEGSLELEAGLAVDPGDTLDSPVALKYGLAPRIEGFVGFAPWRRAEAPDGGHGDGPGDLYLGVRHRVRDEDGAAPALAYQLQVKLATGDEDEGVSSGATDFLAAAIATLTRDPVFWTGFYQLGVLGELGASSGTLEHDLALAASFPVAGPWSGFGEVAGVWLPEEEVEYGLVTLGATYTGVPWRILDLGVAFGVGDDGPDAQLVVGITQNLGHPRRRAGP